MSCAPIRRSLTEVVRRFLASMAAHDWSTAAACVADDVERVGPYGDTYRGRDTYVAFLSRLMPTLQDYSMEVHRVTADERASVVTAELTETMTWDGRRVVTPEALVFDLDGDGRIIRLQVFLQQLPDRERP